MKRIFLILAILAIAGCAATAKTEVKRGKKGLHINCSGLSSSWDNCYSKAATSCSTRGYRVIARSGDSDEQAGDYLFGINPAGYTSRKTLGACRVGNRTRKSTVATFIVANDDNYGAEYKLAA